MAVLCMFVGVAARQQLSSCIVVLTDDNQHMKIEQYGENAIRVRIVQGDSPFLNPPDVISAFDPKVDALRSLQENVTCSKVVMNHQPQTLISGNLRVDVTRPQQTLKFTRISTQKSIALMSHGENEACCVLYDVTDNRTYIIHSTIWMR